MVQIGSDVPMATVAYPSVGFATERQSVATDLMRLIAIKESALRTTSNATMVFAYQVSSFIYFEIQ